MLVKLTEFCTSKKGQMILGVVGMLTMAFAFGVAVHPSDSPTWPM
jgi:hypothetical protein